jgi:hypothetical protein
MNHISSWIRRLRYRGRRADTAVVNVPRHHHYIPRFHLRGFGSGANDEVLWRYDKKYDTFAKRGVGGSAFEEDYYTWRAPDGSSDTEFEALFGKLETMAAPIIKKLRSLPPGEFRIADDDRVNLALYVATLDARVPASRNLVEEMGTFMGCVLVEVGLGSPEAYRQRIEQDGSIVDPEALEVERLELLAEWRKGGLTVKPPTGWDLTLPLEIAIEQVAPALMPMRIVIAHRAAAPFFVLGDHPVTHAAPTGHPPQLGVGFATPGVEVMVPLSADCLLILVNEPNDGRLRVMPTIGPSGIVAGEDWILAMNRPAWLAAERYVFARERADLEAVVAALGEESAREQPKLLVSGLEPEWERHTGRRVVVDPQRKDGGSGHP